MMSSAMHFFKQEQLHKTLLASVSPTATPARTVKTQHSNTQVMARMK
jgi:hypothetical protein